MHVSSMHEIRNQSYQWHPDLRWKLQPLIIHFSQKFDVLNGRIRIDRRGELVFGRCEEEIQADWYQLDRVENLSHIDANVRSAGLRSQNIPNSNVDGISDRHESTFAHPITHAGIELGVLEISTNFQENNELSIREIIEELAKECGYIIQRQQLEEWTENSPINTVSIIGSSQKIHAVECFIEKAIGSTLPVLINGEFGTDKLSVAVSLHAMGPRKDAPFIEVRCGLPEGTPEQWITQADGGTLFLNEVDRLSLECQNQLLYSLTSRHNQWLKEGVKSDYRLVASSNTDLNELVLEEKFLQALLVEIDFLSIELPPLRERQKDIKELAHTALVRHSGKAKIQVDEDTLALFENYSWPQNNFELELTMARLGVMADSETITTHQVLQHTPWLCRESQLLHDRQDILSCDDAKLEDGECQLIDWMMGNESIEPSFSHEGLRRAILFLRDNYDHQISLGELAKAALLSASHLTYLFRTGLHTSFKSLLRRLRIEKAKELLTENQELQINQVAKQVGFIDLSHFERSFKGIVHMSAREFRQQACVNGLSTHPAPNRSRS